MAPVWQIESALSGVSWPAVPAPGAASLLALQFQLESTQWLPADALAALQLSQLTQVVSHAHSTVPHYRECWSGRYDPAQVLTWEAFRRLPLLTRADLQTRFDLMKSAQIPASHGPVVEARTSGSTGTPVCVLKSELCGLFWSAFTLREHAWHNRDMHGKLAAIRQGVKREEGEGWGGATQGAVHTGRAATLPVSTPVSEQLAWLQEQNPEYLLTHPTNLGALAQLSIRSAVRLQRLREARTSGEVLTQEVRDLCRQAWGVPVVDMYSTNEVGYIALQCPQTDSYHAMAEGLLVEVVDESGKPVEAGKVGRILVTTLNNFATPLIRYDIGDYAEVGAPCACGRGLPVLKRIIGRVRNMLVTADGGHYWPSFGMRGLTDKMPVIQHQFVQKDFDLIEVRLVTSRALEKAEEDEISRLLLGRLPTAFRLQFVYCGQIPRSAGGKFEDFISEVSIPAR